MNTYLDTNIFDLLEKIDRLEIPERDEDQKLYDIITRWLGFTAPVV